MINKLLGLAVALALPMMVAAQTPQIPDEHASERGQAMVALHSHGAAHRTRHRRGEVVTVPQTGAIRVTPAAPGHGDLTNVPAKRATPAVPAHKGGQSGIHRP